MNAAPHSSNSSVDLHSKLIRGAVINALGLIGKILGPLFLILITWLYSAETVGVYLLVTTVAEVARSALTAGFGDGAIVYASRDLEAATTDSEAHKRLYSVLGNAIAIPIVLSVVISVLGITLGDNFARMFFQGKGQDVLPTISVAFPFMVFSIMATAATKATMRMQYEVGLNYILSPLFLLAFAVVAWFIDPGLNGLVLSYLVTHVILAAAALWALAQVCSLRELGREIIEFRINRSFLSFAIPQGLNLTLNQYATKLGLLALGTAGYSSFAIAFYGTAERLVYMMREIKLLFGNSLTPIAARFYATGERGDLEMVIGRVARWATTITLTLSLPLVVVRDDLIAVVDPRYQGDTRFMIILIGAMYVYCAYGLAANAITAAGHSRWSLLNSFVMAVVGTVLCWVLVPRYGLAGAAWATTLASAVSIGLANLELHQLEGIAIRWSHVKLPHYGLMICVALLMPLWDPALIEPLSLRIALATALALGYVVVIWMMGHPEVRGLVSGSVRRIAGRRG